MLIILALDRSTLWARVLYSKSVTTSFRLKTRVLSITSQVWTLFRVGRDGFNPYTLTKDDTYNKTLDPFQLS